MTSSQHVCRPLLPFFLLTLGEGPAAVQAGNPSADPKARDDK